MPPIPSIRVAFRERARQEREGGEDSVSIIYFFFPQVSLLLNEWLVPLHPFPPPVPLPLAPFTRERGTFAEGLCRRNVVLKNGLEVIPIHKET